MANRSKNRPTYTEDDKAKVIAVAISMGYPHREGSKWLARESLKHDHRTLKKWYLNVDSGIIVEKIMELKELLEQELGFIFEEMQIKRQEATYKELATSGGIMMDKLILLTGGATSRTETITKTWKELVEDARNDESKPAELK